jgi:hypothetical protein
MLLVLLLLETVHVRGCVMPRGRRVPTCHGCPGYLKFRFSLTVLQRMSFVAKQQVFFLVYAPGMSNNRSGTMAVTGPVAFFAMFSAARQFHTLEAHDAWLAGFTSNQN